MSTAIRTFSFKHEVKQIQCAYFDSLWRFPNLGVVLFEGQGHLQHGLDTLHCCNHHLPIQYVFAICPNTFQLTTIFGIDCTESCGQNVGRFGDF